MQSGWSLALLLFAIPFACVEPPPMVGTDDDAGTETGTESGEACAGDFPVDCGEGRCCPDETVCIEDGGCCPEDTPISCGFDVCAMSEESCESLGGGFPPCPNGVCPEATMFCLDAGTASVCLPECTGCPAPGECNFNPDSSVDNCSDSGTCDSDMETCEPNLAGGMTCLLPSSHCVPRCNIDDDCAVGVSCLEGTCLWPDPE